MTGAGTSSNPYVPESIEELVTAVGLSGAYVSLPPRTVYDFGEIELNSAIQINCVCIDGNGSAFQNISVSSEHNFFEINYDGCTIRRLTFLNFVQNSDHSLFAIVSRNITPFFESGKFKGKAERGSIFYANEGSRFKFRADRKNLTAGGCELEIKLLESGSICQNLNDCRYKYCSLDITADINADAFPLQFNINRCYIYGSVNALRNTAAINISASHSIIDLSVSEAHTINYSGSYSAINTAVCKGTIIPSSPV